MSQLTTGANGISIPATMYCWIATVDSVDLEVMENREDRAIWATMVEMQPRVMMPG